MHALQYAKRLRRALGAVGILSLVAAAGLSLQISPFTAIWPLGDASTVDLYLAAYTAAVGASLLWIDVSGDQGAAVAGAINLTVTHFSLAIALFVLSRSASDPRLPAAALLSTVAAVASAGMALWFRRFPIRDVRPLDQTVRRSFAGFVLLLGLVGTAVLLRMPNIFPLTLGPVPAALVGCSFLGSATYFLYSLTYPVWQNAYAQLWGFLAYDLVLIVPFVLRLGSTDGAHLPALLVNIAVLVYSGALAVYYLLIARATRVVAPRTVQDGCKTALVKGAGGTRNATRGVGHDAAVYAKAHASRDRPTAQTSWRGDQTRESAAAMACSMESATPSAHAALNASVPKAARTPATVRSMGSRRYGGQASPLAVRKAVAAPSSRAARSG
jgi:hypothetical protein